LKKIYTTLSLLLFGFGLLNAQTINTITKNVYQNDTVVLRLNDYIGVIQWQKSADNTNWTDITNANVDTFLFIADQTTYFRAMVTVGNCEPFISDKAEIIISENLAPNTPTSPIPSNGVINQSITPTLGWSCSDPEGDAITYDVYLDANNGTTLVSEGQTDMVYSPIGLSYGTTYYWKIVAKDANDNESTSEVWNFTVIDNLAPTTEEYKIGMLSVILPENCCIPEGCGPTYKLMYPAPDLNEIYPPFTYIPLLGNISHYHDQLIIKVIGEDTILPPEEYGSMNYYGPTYAIFVQEYELLSQIKYHDFLVPEAKNYTEQTYGCFICWNKTFSWEINGNQSIIKVRLTNTFSAETSLPFIELWYDGNTGQFIKEENNLNGNNPCH